MTDLELDRLVAQGVNLGNQHGTNSKDFLDFLVENKEIPELSELLNTAFSLKNAIESSFREEAEYWKLVHLFMMSQIAIIIVGVVCRWIWTYCF